MGIAAGIRGKTQIGNVVLSERVVAYESAVLGTNGEETPRPEMSRISHDLQQDVIYYKSLDSANRLTETFRKKLKGKFPNPPRKANEIQLKEEFRSHVARAIHAQVATIASGEKLLRDPEKLKGVRDRLHGRTEAGEMEAAGLATACHRKGVGWLVIRGISDFGDKLKDDRFHDFASNAAASVLLDFIQYGLCLDSQDGSGSPKSPKRTRDAGRETESTVATNRSRTIAGQYSESKPAHESENRAQIVSDKAAIYRDRMLRLHQTCSIKKLLIINTSPGTQNVNVIDIFEPQCLRPYDTQKHSGSDAGTPWHGAPEGDCSRELPDVLNENQWILLLGEPGIGKTMLSRWLLVRLSEPGAFLTCLNDMTPVRIDLEQFDRQYRDHRARDAYTFFDHISECNRELSIELGGAEVEFLADRGHVFWIFDGIDEVAHVENREKYCQMIAALALKFSYCRGIVTSRIEGSTSDRVPLEGAGFRSYRIEKFTPLQRDRLLNFLCSTLHPRNAEAERHLRSRIEEALAERHALRDLAEVPLYCSLLSIRPARAICTWGESEGML